MALAPLGLLVETASNFEHSDHGAFLAPFNTCQHTALLRCSTDTGQTGRHEKVERQVNGWKEEGPDRNMESELEMHIRSWSAVEE